MPEFDPAEYGLPPTVEASVEVGGLSSLVKEVASQLEQRLRDVGIDVVGTVSNGDGIARVCLKDDKPVYVSATGVISRKDLPPPKDAEREQRIRQAMVAR